MGSEYAAAITVDLTGNGQPELVLRDGQSPYLYVYAWQQGALRKLWQSPLVEGGLGWEIFAGTGGADGSPIVISGTSEPGRYVLYRYGQVAWEER